MVVCKPSLVFSFGPKLNNYSQENEISAAQYGVEKGNDKNETVVGDANPPGMGNEESRNSPRRKELCL